MFFLQNSALELCLQFVLHLSQKASLYSSARGSHLGQFDAESEEFFDKVSVMNRTQDVEWIAKNVSLCPRQIPCEKVGGFGRGSTLLEDLERLPADWERETLFHCKSTLS